MDTSIFANAEINVLDSGNDERIYMYSPDRVLPFYVMSYIRSGTALLRMNGQEYSLRPRSVILVPPFTRHDHIKTGDRPSRFFWWHFHFMLYGTIDLLKTMQFPYVFEVQENDTFEDAFMRFDNISRQPPTLQNVILKKAYAHEIMGLLIGAAENYRSIISFSIPTVFMDMLYTLATSRNQEISLASLSEKYNFHPTYISNKFKEYFGISPIRFGQDMLIERACKMLQYQNMSVNEIADALGYSELSAFSRMFTQKIGIAPSKYAKAVQQRSAADRTLGEPYRIDYKTKS